MNDFAKEETITVNGLDYATENLSALAKSKIESIRFSDERISQLRNELAISNTARAGYEKVLRVGLKKDRGSDG